MATTTSGSLTLIDLAKRMNNNNLLTIAEVISEENDYMRDAAHVEANGTTTNTHNQRVSEPAGAWRALNEGTAVERSTVKQVEEGMGILEAWSQVDAKLVDLAPNKAKFRSDEDLAFVAGLGKTHASTFVYGSLGSNPKSFNGITPRYNSAAQANVWDAAGTNNFTSIWIIQWGDMKVHFIHPRNAKIGLQTDDKGKRVVVDSSGNPYDAYQTKFTWDSGLCIHDDRCIQRVGGIDSDDAVSTTKVDDLIIQALNKMPMKGAGAMIYMNSGQLTKFEINAKDKSNVNYGTKNVWGEDLIAFRGRPLRLMDKITDAETDLTA